MKNEKQTNSSNIQKRANASWNGFVASLDVLQSIKGVDLRHLTMYYIYLE